MILSKIQQTISDDQARFRCISAGRRGGKSFLSINELAKFARHPNRKCLYVAPTYRQAKQVIWDELKSQLYAKNWIKKVNESDLHIKLVNNSTIYIRSSDNKDSLRGTKYDFIVLDECADMGAGDVWYFVLRPTLSDTQGHAMFIGTPKGRGNWFYDLWSSAKEQQDWSQYQYTTLQGGWVSEEEIEAAKRDLDIRQFQQEYEAVFQDNNLQVFFAYSEDNIKKFEGFQTERTPLHIGMDFGVSPSTAILGVKGAEDFHIFDEIEIYSSNTHEVVKEIRNRYGNSRQMFVYPDAAGASRSSSSPGLSDHAILQNNGFIINVKNANPPVAEAITSVNSRLCNAKGERHLFIDPKCKRLRECFVKHSYKEGTKIPDKTQNTDHLTDCVRYVIHSLWPYTRNVAPAVGHKHRNPGRML